MTNWSRTRNNISLNNPGVPPKHRLSKRHDRKIAKPWCNSFVIPKRLVLRCNNLRQFANYMMNYMTMIGTIFLAKEQIKEGTLFVTLVNRFDLSIAVTLLWSVNGLAKMEPFRTSLTSHFNLHLHQSEHSKRQNEWQWMTNILLQDSSSDIDLTVQYVFRYWF